MSPLSSITQVTAIPTTTLCVPNGTSYQQIYTPQHPGVIVLTPPHHATGKTLVAARMEVQIWGRRWCGVDGGVKEEGKKVRGVGKREKGKMVKLLWLIVSIENLEVTIAMPLTR